MVNKKDFQTRIAGTFDPPVEAVQTKAAEYSEALHSRMAMQTRENGLREDLIDLMKEHDCETVYLDGETVTREHIEKDRIKVKAVRLDEA